MAVAVDVAFVVAVAFAVVFAFVFLVVILSAAKNLLLARVARARSCLFFLSFP